MHISTFPSFLSDSQASARTPHFTLSPGRRFGKEVSCRCMNRLLTRLVVPVLLLTSLGTFAAEKTSVPVMPLSQVQIGMRGTAYTVFQGVKPEPMEVEVLGILRNMTGPKGDIILVKLHGAKPEFTGVVAGMSGSPVYIDGKLIGAISYRIGEFSKEPIAGVTPNKAGSLSIGGDGCYWIRPAVTIDTLGKAHIEPGVLQHLRLVVKHHVGGPTNQKRDERFRNPAVDVVVRHVIAAVGREPERDLRQITGTEVDCLVLRCGTEQQQLA